MSSIRSWGRTGALGLLKARQQRGYCFGRTGALERDVLGLTGALEKCGSSAALEITALGGLGLLKVRGLIRSGALGLLKNGVAH